MSADKAPKRTVRTALNRDYIAAVALSVIDETGLDGFSMRKLAAALGADPMAAYRHVTDQQGLFDAVAVRLSAEMDLDNLAWQADWRELMRDYADRLRVTLQRHPHAVPVFASRPVRAPAAIEIGDRMLDRLCEAGFTPAVALQLTRCLREYTIGHVMGWATVVTGRSRKPAPDSPDHTPLAAAADATAGTDHFDLGLTAMLDGFSRHLAPGNP
ncbi:TetR/AcrR family transcriptional regulator C-terminal domain-containing protein [Nocardia vermiculata]|uniref:TetR family transcriptional regulator n=1 Tax=Nocardia vermiculata TaxID=257274 RepID=A0A846Y1Y1_9NOCA|nr:TetR/AcrR family transcriptional regulator C-terminal domain-containing protein [Nocardia vermiculata]NKY53253.1 TetR family transcriptional regulator [Nocardia vermiculata]